MNYTKKAFDEVKSLLDRFKELNLIIDYSTVLPNHSGPYFIIEDRLCVKHRMTILMAKAYLQGMSSAPGVMSRHTIKVNGRQIRYGLVPTAGGYSVLAPGVTTFEVQTLDEARDKLREVFDKKAD